jgi:hypothetical protein
MFLTIILLVLVLFVVVAFRGSPCWGGEETITTVTTHEPRQPHVVGPLKRQVEGGQYFVIDPADQEKIWVNSNDDMYEDADGRVWRLH